MSQLMWRTVVGILCERKIFQVIGTWNLKLNLALNEKNIMLFVRNFQKIVILQFAYIWPKYSITPRNILKETFCHLHLIYFWRKTQTQKLNKVQNHFSWSESRGVQCFSCWAAFLIEAGRIQGMLIAFTPCGQLSNQPSQRPDRADVWCYPFIQNHSRTASWQTASTTSNGTVSLKPSSSGVSLALPVFLPKLCFFKIQSWRWFRNREERIWIWKWKMRPGKRGP